MSPHRGVRLTSDFFCFVYSSQRESYSGCWSDTISEFDPAQFQRQLAAVFAARTALTGCCPEVMFLAGHNHVSPAMHLGSESDVVGDQLADYVRRIQQRA